ncbi:hypothetical protein MASR1M12_24850 [Erysipelotrichia bacterium]
MGESRFTETAKFIARQLKMQFLHFLGAGAFKETFLVNNDKGMPFALKLVDPDKLHEERLKREVTANITCQSAYIARLHEYGSAEHSGRNWFYVVEEYLDGGTLTGKLPVSVKFAENFIVCLLKAISCLKDHNLVHRDIKPDNIMFRSGSDNPVLVDFGLVRALNDSSITQSWLMMGPGTPYFASPEQLNNDKYLISWLSDQFSLALTTAFALTSRHPFAPSEGENTEAVSRVAGREMVADWFKEYAIKNHMEYLLKMLEPWPHRRFNNIDDLLKTIHGR